MKNTYIIALDYEELPHIIKQRPMECLCRIGRNYKNAYICETKKEATEIWLKWYKQYQDKKTNLSINQ